VKRVFWPKPLLSFEKVSIERAQRFVEGSKETTQKNF